MPPAALSVLGVLDPQAYDTGFGDCNMHGGPSLYGKGEQENEWRDLRHGMRTTGHIIAV